MIDSDYLTHQREWSEATFGPGRRTDGVTDHIRKELIEVVESDGSLSEWVDVIILAMDGAIRTAHADGLPMQAVLDAVAEKQSRNERRQWPDWRTADPNKAIEHVRNCQVPCETRRFGMAPCGTPLPCDAHPDGVTEDRGRLREAVKAKINEISKAVGDIGSVW